VKKVAATRPSDPIAAGAFAALLGTHRNTVANWIKDEGLPAHKHGRVLELSLSEAVRWVRARDLAASEAKLKAATSTPDIDRERQRLVCAQADVAEMDRDRKRGDLVSRPEAERVWSQHVLQVRARLLSLPAHARTRGLDPRAVAVIEELVRKALDSLASNAGDDQDDDDDAEPEQ
jgi:phage terminase Nu1 subunit (DNA packaging protein)